MMLTPSEYKARLDAFYSQEKITVAHFSCAHLKRCQGIALNRELTHGAEALVGSQYGLACKIVVIAPRRASSLGPGTNSRGEEPALDSTAQNLAALRLVKKVLAKEIKNTSIAPYFATIYAAKCSGKSQSHDPALEGLIQQCRPFAQMELSILDPDIVVTLGEEAKSFLEQNYSEKGVDIHELLSPANALGAEPVFDGLTLDWLEAVALRYLSKVKFADRDIFVLHAPHPEDAPDPWKMFEQLHLPICTWLIQELLSHRKPA